MSLLQNLETDEESSNGDRDSQPTDGILYPTDDRATPPP